MKFDGETKLLIKNGHKKSFYARASPHKRARVICFLFFPPPLSFSLSPNRVKMHRNCILEYLTSLCNFFHFCLAGFRYRRRRFVQSQNTVQCMSEWPGARCGWAWRYSEVGSGPASATKSSGRALRPTSQCAGQLSGCSAAQTTLPAVCHQSPAFGYPSPHGQELNGHPILHLGSRGLVRAASPGLSAFR